METLNTIMLFKIKKNKLKMYVGHGDFTEKRKVVL
jgi:hypothetical protein